MQTIILIGFMSLMTFSVYSLPTTSSRDEEQRCNNPVHTRCLLMHDTMSLWCDQTNLSSLPQPVSIRNTQVHPGMSRYLFINQSCVSRIDKDVLRHYTHLVVLDVSQNRISVLQHKVFKHLSRLETLLLAQNKIARVESGAFIGLNNLQSLDIGSNKLISLSRNVFNNLNKLRILKINNNDLTQIPQLIFRKLKSLQELDLSGNNLYHFLPKHGLTNLKSLNLGGNRLTSFNSQLLLRVPQLKEINLSNNSFQCLDDDAFSNGKNVMAIYLRENPLHTPKKSWFTLVMKNNKKQKFLPKDFSNIISTKGHWRCDCDALPYLKFLTVSDQNSHWSSLLDVQCRFPTPLKGRMLSNVTTEELFKHSECTGSGMPPVCPKITFKEIYIFENSNPKLSYSEVSYDAKTMEQNTESKQRLHFTFIMAFSLLIVFIFVSIIFTLLDQRKQREVRKRNAPATSKTQLLSEIRRLDETSSRKEEILFKNSSSPWNNNGNEAQHYKS